MSINKIQFQKGLSIFDFMKLYGTEDQCHIVLKQARWPNGFQCEECGHLGYCYIKSRKLYQCNSCKHQTTIIRNTVFHNTNLPLTKWFLSMFLISQSKNGISSLELGRQVDVSYKTAWKIKHKLMQVMMERDQGKKLSGIIEADDAYLGGKKNGGKRGRGSENKQPFIAAVSTTDDNRPIFIKLSTVPTFDKKSVVSWSKKNLQSGSTIYTDGLLAFLSLTGTGLNHNRIVIGKKAKSTDNPRFNWVNTVLGNLKNAIKGTYHSNGYESRYLSEFQYRFNRRFDLKTIFKRLLFAAVQTPPLQGRLLKMAANCT